jgi:transposase
MAIELSNAEWQLGFTVGMGQAPRLRKLAARNLAGLLEEIRLSKVRFGLLGSTRVMSCYEAGRDGFWLHRYLTVQGVTNLVVDSASIEVNRRKRRAKTDRMDVGKLLTMLVRYGQGEKRSGVCYTTREKRQLHRADGSQTERTHHINGSKACGQG